MNTVHRGTWVRAALISAPLGMALLLGACSAVGGPGGSTPTGAAPGATTGATPTPTGASGQASNPCTLLTPDELKGALGPAFGPGEYDDARGECVWNPTGSSGPVSLSVAALDQDLFDFARTNAGAEPIAGVGDDAYFENNGQMLVIKKGSRELTLSALATGIKDKAVLEDALAGLGKKAAARL